MIVRVSPGGESKGALAVARLGGTTGRRLAIIDGFVAEVLASRLGTLSGLPFVRSVSANSAVRSLGADYSGSRSGEGHGLDGEHREDDRCADVLEGGLHGKGIDVAVIDTGVAPVDGLTAPGKVINGPDLSFDSQEESTRYVDRHGHGTHMAGIIAGRADAVGRASTRMTPRTSWAWRRMHGS